MLDHAARDDAFERGNSNLALGELEQAEQDRKSVV